MPRITAKRLLEISARLSRALSILVGVSFCVVFMASEPLRAQIVERWEVFSAQDRSSSVAIDPDGALWVGTAGGAYRYDATSSSIVPYRTDSGLYRLDVSAVGVDPTTGDVYFGSSDGSVSILRDGGWWTYVTDVQRTSRTDRRINRIMFRDGLTYLLTNFGVSVFDASDSTIRESWTRLGTIPFDTRVTDLHFHDDSIWVATPLGLAVAPDDGRDLADPLNWRVYDTVTGCSADLRSLEVIDGKLSLGTADGVCTLDNGMFVRRSDINGAVELSRQEGLLIAANGSRLYKMNESGLFVEIADPPHEVVAATALQDGRVAAAMDRGGLFVSEGESGTIVVPNGPGSNTFADLTIDGNRDLWVGTSVEGISRLSGNTWFNYTDGSPSDLTTNSSRYIRSDDRGNVWSGSFGGGFFVFDVDSDPATPSILHFNSENSALRGISNDEDFVIGAEIVVDDFGNTWALNWDNTSGIRGSVLLRVLYDGDVPTGFEQHPASNAFPSLTREFDRIVSDFFGTLWLGGEGGQGILYYVPDDQGTTAGVWRRLTTADGLDNNSQTSLLVDPDGELWIGTTAGINVLVNPGSVAESGSSAAIFRDIPSPKDVRVNDIASDALNRKWVATDDGLYLLSVDGTELLASFTTDNSPLVSNDVLSIEVQDSTGAVWVGTSAGMNRIVTEAVVPQGGNEISVSPQPFDPGTDGNLRIAGLPRSSTIKVLTISGTLVAEFEGPGGDLAYWDGKDTSGEAVPPGVYIIAAESPDGTTAVGKCAVVWHR